MEKNKQQGGQQWNNPANKSGSTPTTGGSNQPKTPGNNPQQPGKQQEWPKK